MSIFPIRMAKQPCFMVILFHNKYLTMYIILILIFKACHQNSTASLNALIHARALTNIKDNSGETVLDYGEYNYILL